MLTIYRKYEAYSHDYQEVIMQFTSNNIHIDFYQYDQKNDDTDGAVHTDEYSQDQEQKTEQLPEETVRKLISQVDIRLEDIRTSPNVDDGSLYVLDVEKKTLKPHSLFNYTAFSMSNRSNIRIRDTAEVELMGMLYIFLPYAEASFDECEFYFITVSNTKVEANVEKKELPLVPMVSYQNMESMLYPIELSANNGTISAGGQEDITITVRDHEGNLWDYPMEVYLSSNVGYLPYRKIKVTGTTTIPVCALGLKAGDVMRIKAGYRWYVNFTHLDLEVI